MLRYLKEELTLRSGLAYGRDFEAILSVPVHVNLVMRASMDTGNKGPNISIKQDAASCLRHVFV